MGADKDGDNVATPENDDNGEMEKIKADGESCEIENTGAGESALVRDEENDKENGNMAEETKPAGGGQEGGHVEEGENDANEVVTCMEEEATMAAEEGEKTPNKSPMPRQNMKASRKMETPKGKDGTAAEDEKEQQSSDKESKSAGMIFMCNSRTKQDCFHYKIFGLPSAMKENVEKISKGMHLFLFDLETKLLHGIYKAAGPGGFNIVPKAFGSEFPSQVPFKTSEDHVPLPEEKFKLVIKDNYYTKNKFRCQLSAAQVKKLCKLFRKSRRPNVDPFMGQMYSRDAHGFLVPGPLPLHQALPPPAYVYGRGPERPEAAYVVYQQRPVYHGESYVAAPSHMLPRPPLPAPQPTDWCFRPPAYRY